LDHLPRSREDRFGALLLPEVDVEFPVWKPTFHQPGLPSWLRFLVLIHWLPHTIPSARSPASSSCDISYFAPAPRIIGRFPEIVDSTLIVPFIVAALRVIRGRSIRENALLLAAITTSIWVIHGLEVITAVVVACGLLAVAVVSRS